MHFISHEPNDKNKNGETALHFAALYNSNETAELHISNNANLNEKENHIKAALFCAENYNLMVKSKWWDNDVKAASCCSIFKFLRWDKDAKNNQRKACFDYVKKWIKKISFDRTLQNKKS